MNTLLEPVLHAVIALGLLAAYCTLWALGHQDAVLLGLLGGQLGGLGVGQVAAQAVAAKQQTQTGQPAAPAPPPVTQ